MLHDPRRLGAVCSGNFADEQQVRRRRDEQLQLHGLMRLDAIARGEIVEPDDLHQIVRDSVRSRRIADRS